MQNVLVSGLLVFDYWHKDKSMDLFKTPLSRAESFLLFKLTFILLMSGLLFSGQAFAENDDGGLLDFSIFDGDATITGFTAGASTTTLTIPATVSTGSIT